MGGIAGWNGEVDGRVRRLEGEGGWKGEPSGSGRRLEAGGRNSKHNMSTVARFALLARCPIDMITFGGPD